MTAGRRSDPGTGGCGTQQDHQMRKRPAPTPSPSSSPITPRPSFLGPREQRGQVETGASEPVLVRREAAPPDEPPTGGDEQVGDLDDVALDPTGDGGDLADPPGPVVLENGMDDDVDRPGHRRDDEAAADVLAGQQ